MTANTWQNGMVTSVYQYDPYGQVTLGSTEHADFYGYNAESYNPNTGLEYLRARYYNADKGRFFQEDTYLGDVTDPLTLNRYAYVKNSPLNYVDPSGHKDSKQSKEGGKTTQEVYENLPAYLTGDAPENNRNPYAASQQNDWYKKINPDKHVEIKSLNWKDAKGRLDKWIEKAKASSVYKNCDIFWKGVEYGTADAGKAIEDKLMKMTENSAFGYILKYLKVKTYRSDEEHFEELYSAFLKAAQRQSIAEEELEEYFDIFENGANAGYFMAYLSILQMLLAPLSGESNTIGTERSVVVQDSQGRVYARVYADADAEILTGILGAGAHIQIMEGENEGESDAKIQPGDKTPKGREYTQHGAERANERGFDSQKVDSIIDNNYKHRTKEIDKLTGKVTWRYQDKRGNTVITNEWGDKIVTVYSHPTSTNGGNYIPKN